MIPQRAGPRVDPVGLTDRCDRSGSFQRMSSVEFLKPGGEKILHQFPGSGEATGAGAEGSRAPTPPSKHR